MNKKRKYAVFFIVFLMLLNTFAVPEVLCLVKIQLTDNEYYDWYPRINNGQVTWEGSDGHDSEIFLYNGSTVTQLTDNEYHDLYPQIHNGQVTWGYSDGHDYEIFLYDGSTVTQLTDNEYDVGAPHIHDGQVIWCGFDGHDYEIFLYDGFKVTQLTDDEYDQYGPKIHDGQVTWKGFDGHDYEIFLYDGFTVTQLTDNEYDDLCPQIHKGQVTWGYSDGHDSEIFLYNGFMVTQLTDNEYDDSDPQIHDGQVTWEGSDGHDDEIFLYNGFKVTQLTDNEYHDLNPQIHNGQVIWYYFDGHDYEIFLYDGFKVTQLTDNEYDDSDPQIHDGQVIWHRYDGHDFEIFLYPYTRPIIPLQLIISIRDGIVDILSILEGISTSLDNLLNNILTTQNRIQEVQTTLNKKMTLNVASGAKTSEHLTYYLHLTQWPDGELLDTLDPSVTWRIGINERILWPDEYQIQSMSFGLCKLTVNRDSVPLGNNMIFIEAEKSGVKVSAIEEISNTIGETVNIGVILPSEAKYDTAQPVIEMAEAHINDYCSNVGYDISFDFNVEDASGTAIGHQEKVEAFHDSGVDMLIAGFWSSQAAESLTYVNDNDMIMFSPSSTSHDLAIPNDNLYRLVSDDTLQAKAIATLLERNGVDSIVVMQPDWGLINSITDALETEFTDRGGTMYPRIVYPTGAMNDLGFDFTDYLVEAEALAYDNVKDENVSLVVLGLEETAQIMNQVYVGYKDYSTLHDLDWFGWMETPFSTIESVAPDAAARYGMASTVAVPTKSKQWFDFSDSLGYEPTFYDACIYDICWIYAKSVLESASVSTENIKSVMPEVTSQYFGVTGWCNLNEDGDRYPIDYDIMIYDEVFGWRTWGTYEKIAETIFEK